MRGSGVGIGDDEGAAAADGADVALGRALAGLGAVLDGDLAAWDFAVAERGGGGPSVKWAQAKQETARATAMARRAGFFTSGQALLSGAGAAGVRRARSSRTAAAVCQRCETAVPTAANAARQ